LLAPKDELLLAPKDELLLAPKDELLLAPSVWASHSAGSYPLSPFCLPKCVNVFPDLSPYQLMGV